MTVTVSECFLAVAYLNRLNRQEVFFPVGHDLERFQDQRVYQRGYGYGVMIDDKGYRVIIICNQ